VKASLAEGKLGSYPVGRIVAWVVLIVLGGIIGIGTSTPLLSVVESLLLLLLLFLVFSAKSKPNWLIAAISSAFCGILTARAYLGSSHVMEKKILVPFLAILSVSTALIAVRDGLRKTK
jgi:hypothetical protein